MAVGPSKLVVAVALDRWSPLAGAIYSKKRRGDRESGREGRWSPLAGGRLYRVHCTFIFTDVPLQGMGRGGRRGMNLLENSTYTNMVE